MVVGLALVVMKRRDALHIVAFAKFVREALQHLLKIEPCILFGKRNNQLPCFNALSLNITALELNLSFFGKGRPKRRIGGLIGGVKILLPCVAGDIVDSSFDIRQLRHLNKAVSCHITSICLRRPQLPAGAKYTLHKFREFVQKVYFALSRRGLFIYSTLRTSL